MKNKLLRLLVPVVLMGIMFLCVSCGEDIIDTDRNNETQEELAESEEPNQPEESEETDQPNIPEDIPDETTPEFNPQDLSPENCVYIKFSGGAAAIINPFENNGITVTDNAGHIVINSTVTDTELNYVLSGETSAGSVKIYGEYKFNLYLNNVNITNPKGAAINIQCSKKISVTVVDDTYNKLVDGANYEPVNGEDMKGTFFSEGQLNFYGTGALEVSGKYKHAICTDGYLRIYDGNITVKEAVSDAFHANDYIQVDAGQLLLKSTGDGLDCEKGYVEINGGTIDITTEGAKAHAVKSTGTTTVNSTGSVVVKVSGTASKGFNSTGDMVINRGNISITTTGGAVWDTSDSDISSASGIKCDGKLTIEDGNVTITSSGTGGKGISVDGELIINGGNINITTSGGRFTYGKEDTAAKAIKSDGNLTVNNGKITIKTTGTEAEGLESKNRLTINGGEIEIEANDDCINAKNHIEITGGRVYCISETNDGIDSNGTLTVSGGLIVSAGAKSPEEGFDCDQNRFTITGGTLVGLGGATSSPTASACTQYSLIYGANLSVGSIVHIVSATGTEVLTLKLPKASNTMLFSSPNLAAGTKYTIYTGGSISGGTDFHGLYTGATYSKGTEANTFTTSSMVTKAGTTSQGPGGGGRF